MKQIPYFTFYSLLALSGMALIQAAYLLWANRSNLDDPPAAGRRRAVHAFAGYTAATALVLLLPLTGVLD